NSRRSCPSAPASLDASRSSAPRGTARSAARSSGRGAGGSPTATPPFGVACLVRSQAWNQGPSTDQEQRTKKPRTKTPLERAVVFYISSHGFGHASRQIEVINTLTSGAPELRVIVRSRIPTWLVEASVHRPVVLQPADTDTGVVQIDSLTTD